MGKEKIEAGNLGRIPSQVQPHSLSNMFIEDLLCAYLQPKPTRTVKIMSNSHNKECQLLDPEVHLGNGNLPAENSAW